MPILRCGHFLAIASVEHHLAQCLAVTVSKPQPDLCLDWTKVQYAYRTFQHKLFLAK